MKINQTLKQAGQSLIALHGRFSKQKQWKAWTTLSTLAVAIALIATFGQNGTREREGTLKAPVTIPIVMEGKQVGSTKLAPGSSVSILEEQGDRVLIKTRSGETWVAAGDVEIEAVGITTQEPVATITKTGQETSNGNQAGVSNNRLEPKPTPNLETQKKVLIAMTSGTYSPLTKAFMQELEKRGWSLTIIAPQEVGLYPTEALHGPRIEGEEYKADLFCPEYNNEAVENNPEYLKMYEGYDAIFLPELRTYMGVPLKKLFGGEIKTGRIVVGEVVKQSHLKNFLRTGVKEKRGAKESEEGTAPQWNRLGDAIGYKFYTGKWRGSDNKEEEAKKLAKSIVDQLR
jgi:hypothetical protein